MIDWSESRSPNKECGYDHVVAETPLGLIRVEWKSWKERPGFDVTLPWGYEVLSAENVEEAKVEVKRRWDEKLAECVAYSDNEWML